MKSRLAILGLLVSGLLFSTAGAGLALQGTAGSGTNAAISQYATPTPTPTATPQCTPTPDAGRNNGGSSDACRDSGVLPAEENNAPASDTGPGTDTGAGVSPAEEGAQPTRQQAAAAQTSQLPFTGFAAIPVLLGGLALLTGGLVLRRRTRES